MRTPASTPIRSALVQPFYPSLDGLRALSITLVFVVHFGGTVYAFSPLKWGWVGVDIFFVLSGFLITGILYDSLQNADFFRNFYVRRSLRIFPLYYAVWIVLLALGLLPHVHQIWQPRVFSYLLYLGNFFMPHVLATNPPVIRFLVAMGSSIRTPSINIGYFWSLCVEEQFYLIWPAVIWFVRKRRALLAGCLTVVVFAPILRALYLHVHPEAVTHLYDMSISRVDTLMVGAAVALWLRGPAPAPVVIRRFAATTVAASTLCLVLLWKLEGSSHPLSSTSDPMVVRVGFSLIAFAAAGLLLLSLDPSTSLARFFRLPPLVFIGRLSYGLYLLHGMIEWVFLTQLPALIRHHMTFVVPLVGPILTLAVAWTSFRWLESPFLRLKDRFAPTRHPSDPPPASQTG